MAHARGLGPVSSALFAYIIQIMSSHLGDFLHGIFLDDHLQTSLLFYHRQPQWPSYEICLSYGTDSFPCVPRQRPVAAGWLVLSAPSMPSHIHIALPPRQPKAFNNESSSKLPKITRLSIQTSHSGYDRAKDSTGICLLSADIVWLTRDFTARRWQCR